MEFTIDDVGQLYGDRLYQIAEPGETLTARPNTPIEWRHRPTGRVTLLLTRDDFHNRELTGFLRELIVRSGLATEQISFGVCSEGGVAPELLTDMPTTSGVCFAPISDADAKGVWRSESRVLHPAPGLMRLRGDIQAQKKLVVLLAGLK